MTKTSVQLKLKLKLRGIFLADDSPEILTNPVGDIFSYIISAINSFFQCLIYPFEYIFNSIISAFQFLINSIGDIFTNIISAISGFFKFLINSVGDIFSNINSAFQFLINSVGDIFTNIISAINSFFKFLINSPSELFTNIISTINSFFQRLIEWFNQEFPPEARDEQIRHWLNVATPYLVVAAVLITCFCFRTCISSILVGCYNAIRSLFQCICWCVRSLFRSCVSLFQCIGRCVRSLFRSCVSLLQYIGRCVCRCFCCGSRMMIAPGRSPLMIVRAAFEANPRSYFLSLRGLPNNFVKLVSLLHFRTTCYLCDDG